MEEPQKSKMQSMIRNFLFSTVNKEFLIFLFFLALSSGFWLMASLNETYEKEFLVPVRMVNVPTDVVVTAGEDDTIRVILKDKGFVIWGYSLSEQLQPLIFNFAAYANKHIGRGTIANTELQKQVYSQLSGSTRIVSIKPERLDFHFNFGESKKVPIRMMGKVMPGAQRYLAASRFSPEYVTIYASKQILDSIHYVQTDELNIVNFTDTITTRVSLKKIPAVKMIPSQVKLALYPDILTEESIEVPIHAINMPEGMRLRTFPAKVKVRLIIGASQFRTIREDMFKVVVDYRELIAHPSDKCKITLQEVPADVSKAHLEIEAVDYLVEQ
ncbi:MAG: YbbR-like domain-containing protein [Prevotella sp.]|nr:YbbR-like domain-containing protein [Prevotella sp.]